MERGGAASGKGWTGAALGAALVVAVGARLVALSHVFTPGGVRFVSDGDPYYHAFRARHIALLHEILWRDAGLNHPYGADVPWPPLFDVAVAAAGWILGGGTPSATDVDTVAAVVPVVLGVLGVLAGAILARRLVGDLAAVAAGFALALSPTASAYGQVGRADQHVLEALLLTCMLLVVERALASPRRRRWWGATLLGALLCAAFWTWLGSALLLAVLCAVVAAGYVLAPPADGSAARGAGVVAGGAAIAAVLLAASIGLFAPPGSLARVTVGGLSAFPVMLCAAAASGCACVWILARRPRERTPLRRGAEMGVAAVLAVAGALAVPAWRDAVSRGLAAASRGNAWYASISEFRPLFLSSYQSLPAELANAFERFGLLPLLALAGGLELRRAWRSEPARRPGIVFLATLGLLFAILVAAAARFAYYAALPLALLAGCGAATIARAAFPARALPARAAAVSLALLAVAPGWRQLTPAGWASPRFDAVVRALAPITPGEGGLAPGATGAVLASWDAGHHVRFITGRPVLASPFGTEGGPGAMEDLSAFFLEEDPERAAALLAWRDVRWLLVERPSPSVLTAAEIARVERPPVTVVGDRLSGFRLHVEEGYGRLVVSRLYYEGSGATRSAAALGGYRLLADAGPPGAAPVARLFEIVRGATALVRGAAPGAVVTATAEVESALGRFPWSAQARAGPDGRAALRLPYATGRNGGARASAYVVSDGAASAVLAVAEEHVQAGAELGVSLSPDAAARER